MMLFAESSTNNGEVGVLAAIVVIASSAFAWLRRRETRKIKELDRKQTTLKVDLDSQKVEADRQKVEIAEQKQEIIKLQHEVEICHEDRRNRDAMINRLEEARIEFIQRLEESQRKQIELHQHVEELRIELDEHKRKVRR